LIAVLATASLVLVFAPHKAETTSPYGYVMYEACKVACIKEAEPIPYFYRPEYRDNCISENCFIFMIM